MNHAKVIVAVRGFRAGVFYAVVGAILGCASADPRSESNKPVGAAAADANSQEVVDCLLPGQIRRLDETVTYLTDRRPVRTTMADCKARGGTIQPSEELTETPAKSAE
jgi:hypothetical protein